MQKQAAHEIDMLIKWIQSNCNWYWSAILKLLEHTVIYMAIAENPFVTSTGVPATAR
jgi:hypothetical protein